MASHAAPSASRRSSSYVSRMSPIAGASSTARPLPPISPVNSTRVGDSEIFEEWDGPESSFLGSSDGSKRKHRKGKKKKDEPMKPTTVILYVVFFYIVWQILTRPSESEILSHLDPSSPHHYHYSQLPESSNSNPYHLPYQFPHMPSHLPAASPSSSSDKDPSPSLTRMILSWIFYPFYLLLFPLTLILNIGHVLFSILRTLLLPFTSTGRILAQLFILTPYSWAAAFGRAIYPIYVFVGGMLGIGCVMGLGAGWASKKSLELIVGRIKSKGEMITKSTQPKRDHVDDQGYRTARHPDLVYRAEQQSTVRSRPSVRYSVGSSESEDEVYTNPRTPVRSRRVPSVYPHDSVSKRGDKGKAVEGGIGPSREATVVGTRRRGVRYDDD